MMELNRANAGLILQQLKSKVRLGYRSEFGQLTTEPGPEFDYDMEQNIFDSAATIRALDNLISDYFDSFVDKQLGRELDEDLDVTDKNFKQMVKAVLVQNNFRNGNLQRLVIQREYQAVQNAITEILGPQQGRA